MSAEPIPRRANLEQKSKSFLDRIRNDQRFKRLMKGGRRFKRVLKGWRGLTGKEADRIVRLVNYKTMEKFGFGESAFRREKRELALTLFSRVAGKKALDAMAIYDKDKRKSVQQIFLDYIGTLSLGFDEKESEVNLKQRLSGLFEERIAFRLNFIFMKEFKKLDKKYFKLKDPNRVIEL